MNIVKGVADLIRRTSGIHTVESGLGSQLEKFSPPGPKICFSEVGEEAVLNTLWLRCESAVDKVEKRKLFHVFLKQFLFVFKNWQPDNGGQLPESASTIVQSAEYSSHFNDIIIGCCAGHPSEIILILIEELTQLTALVTELNTNMVRSTIDLPWASSTLIITSEGLPVLDALTIVVRSMHNCRVFGHYGGIQKLTPLLKGAVVQLKTISCTLSADESFSNVTVERTILLKQILVHVVSIMCNFIELNPTIYEKAHLCSAVVEFSVSRGRASPIDSSSSLKVPFSEPRLHWHQKAVVSVMEAGGLNWLVELLRVIRRLSMKEQWTDISLQYLTLRTLFLALSENPRGQNHFKSIGGLEVLLDGLGLPIMNVPQLNSASQADIKRDKDPFPKVFQLHVLSLEVLREAVFGNLNSLQFLFENGRVHKFANSFCSPAFLLHEYKQQIKNFSRQEDFRMSVLDLECGSHENSCLTEPSADNLSFSELWNDYVVNLSSVLCLFLPAQEDVKSPHDQVSTGRVAMPVSSMYSELSIKWFMRVLHTVFPCIRACLNENELPSHLRMFVNALQHCILNAFRKVIVSSPGSLEVFRAEGMWDLIFSENFFYFGSISDELSEERFTYKYSEELPRKLETCSPSSSTKSQVKPIGIEILQIEVISFVEFIATSSSSVHNMPELSVLLDALEQSACNPEIANALARSLLRILQLSPEKTVASFKTLNAIPKVLKVACIQAEESRRSGDSGPAIESDQVEVVPPHINLSSNSFKTAQSLHKCMETCVELFMEFFLMTDDSRNVILRNSTSIDCLFDLFWEEGLRNYVLKHILDLMKIVPFSEEDQKAKLYLCSKYLETFTQIKEREKSFAELSIDLLVGMRDMLLIDPVYYQAFFRDGECFLHVVSLLNGNLDAASGEKLVLNVLETLTCLLASNDASKAAFRALVGKGYQTLQSLLLDFCQYPSEGLLNALLDMLVDGKFNLKGSPFIKNEDVIILYLSVLQKSSDSLRHYGLNVFLQLLRDSISNRASCVRAGMLNFLLGWFSEEENDGVILEISQLIQIIGGHSISGKDIRKIFALLRSEKVGTRLQYCSLLLTTVLSMLNEKGPTAFFDLNGKDSGIIIKTPVQWPVNKGFSFSCWLRVENFHRSGPMGLFSFLTENGRGCVAVLAKDKLIYESINTKQQCVQMDVSLVRKKWHFLCLTHSIGRAFSGGSLLRCYVDGDLLSSEKCRYSKVSELLTSCSIGTKIDIPRNGEDTALNYIQDSFPFFGQIGPVYLFSDAISSEQVQGIYFLGPSYMYSFLDNEAVPFYESPMPSGILDTKDGLASKIVFGLNAQASDGRKLFNVSPVLDQALDKSTFEATVTVGTQLCSRCLLQQIIYCVGGVSVFFPLISQSDRYENEESGLSEHASLTLITKERLTAEVIELIASVLDENLANQQQMHLLSGFSILGFLLQSVPPQQLNLETLAALKHLFNVVANCTLAELLVKDAISSIFLNPFIWLYTVYKVQRELYMFLIQQFDNDPRLLKSLCQLPRVIDIIRQFYWDNARSRFAIGSKPLLHPVSKQVIGERPGVEEIRKIRLLLLSLGEMSLRQNIAAVDIKALVAFFETSQDMTCVEDVLHMVIRAVSQKPLLASFLEQVNLIGGCHIFVNLLQREYEPVRLLSLQFLGRLLVGLPSEKKGPRFFNIGRSRSLSERHKKISRMQPIFSAISDRLFKFPQTDNLCCTLFDVLLGGASPKQVLQKHNQVDRQRNRENNSHFFLPQILVLIFRFLSGCKDASARIKIISDLLDLLDSNPSNIESLMEYGWNSWLAASVKLYMLKDNKLEFRNEGGAERIEQDFVRSLFCVVLCYNIHSLKGGWQQLEETVNFLLVHFEEGGISYRHFLRDMFEDIVGRLVDLSAEENIFILQPCRDNALYLLRLVDEMLISEIDQKLPFPANSSKFSLDSLELESHKDQIFKGEVEDKISRNLQNSKQSITSEYDTMDDKWWHLYDNVWIIISEMNGKGPSKMLSKLSSPVGASLGQRARGLVESLNIPAAEMAAVVVAGGIGNALGGKPGKNVDKAMLLRGDRCPRIVFRLVILYLCKASLERASRCVQQIISLLPSLLAVDDELSKNRLQLFIGALLDVRAQYGMLDDGARFHVVAHLIRETVNCGKSVLANSIVGKDDSSDSSSNSKDTGFIHNLIQKDRVLAAVSDEAKYMKTVKSDRSQQLHELRTRMDESSSVELDSKKAFEDEIQSSLNTVLASDENRRAAFQLTHEEGQQNISEKWIRVFRSLIDERGPWSANPFPNSVVIHWKLDKTEDSWRRRPKLRQNYHFDDMLCHPSFTAPSDEAILHLNESKSNFAGHIPDQMKQFLLKGVHRITEEGSPEPGETDNETSGEKTPIPEVTSDNRSLELVKDSEQKDIVQDRKDSSTSSPETETSEVLMLVPCVLVTPKRKLAGQLAVLQTALRFFGEFLVEGTGGSSVIKNFQALNNSASTKSDQKQKFMKWPLHFDLYSEKGISFDNEEVENLHPRHFKNVKRHRRWSIGKIKAVHWTRYLLRYTAIEIFFSDSVAPIFLNFASPKNAKEVGTLIVTTRNDFLSPKGSSRDKSGAITFVDRRVALEMAEIARESWRRRNITNFEYLMILNTLAGRSYNDLTQYPVFPWVLADYSSEVLDFNKSSTFRDLSKPVGALDLKRFEVFEDRYRNFSDPDIPSFYYGSHYSSMGIVLYYLLRLEPFTSLHRNLQGGKFDHADRLFQSIDSTYRNCLSNTSDVKELIPEFFYMPEFLVNSNSYHLGVKQDGEPIADVCLPPWAKGSPEVFINKNREALESEYVSSNIHHWIDLVFGYKQRGKPAVEAANIFYYLTYEGAVDLDTMEDELQRSAIEDQIANFGQTPIQIFRKKHPRRGPPIPIAHPLYFAPDSINLTSIVCSTSHSPTAILYVGVLDSNVVLVNQGLTLSVKMWLTTQLQSGGNFTFSGFQDPFFEVGYDILSPRKVGSPLAENVELGTQCFAMMQMPSENFLISCGTWENSFQVLSLNDGRMVQSIRQHKDVVSCVAVTADGSILATGSYDTTVMVWEVRARSPEKRVRCTPSELHRKDYVIVETPFHILCGHDDVITCLYVSVELDIVISGSKDGTCVFHTLRDGRYVRSLRHPSGSAISKLVASQHGRIILYADDDLSLHLYSINGKHIASSESNGRLNCVELSGCGEYLVCAGDQGQIVVRSMNTLEVVKRYNGVGKMITSLTVTPEECFLAGTKDGILLVYSIENPQFHKGSLPRNVKSKASVTG
ncbi:WD40 domain-containing protein/Beach domain-containing protein/Laminin_G_3 domain-containing protein [Cephalotus follicularis]|uniref:WD40 domain-containing protein/Beach domain-containing protein/Laminin_G_3 domain-containing protein n=1 Tax=Cephalotus follicularis TaxID=3775 RepID=A0A1Q3BG71_CEPFO|nr:WD40 domain-containing protein/Beach domain-containing protein/Laminin_G_3 domain-containing protein [Cephalotus follicularis]